MDSEFDKMIDDGFLKDKFNHIEVNNEYKNKD